MHSQVKAAITLLLSALLLVAQSAVAVSPRGPEAPACKRCACVRCDSACCARASGQPAQQVPGVPGPETSRQGFQAVFQPISLVVATLEPSDRELSPGVPALLRVAAVPLFQRNCVFLI
jgi:hypothetical protein